MTKDDFALVESFGSWYRNDAGYAVKKTRINGKNVSIRMHALINRTPKGWHTDHINGNKLDNRKKNLRTASASLNAWNRHKEREHLVHEDLPRGMSFDTSRDQYVATKTIRKRFDTMKEAQRFIDSGVDEL